MSSQEMVIRSTAGAPGVTVRGGASLGNLVGMEWRKLRKRRMTHVLFGFLILAAIGGTLIGHTSGMDEARVNFLMPQAIQTGFELAQFLGGITLPILGAAVAGSEYGWGTMRVLISSGVGRGKLIAGKLGALVLVTIVYLFVAAGLVSLASTVASLVIGEPVTLGTLDAAWFRDVAGMIGINLFYIYFMIVLGFSVALLGRSMAAGIGVAIGLPIVEQIGAMLAPRLLGDFGETLVDFFTTSNAMPLMLRAGFGPHELPEGLLNPWRAFATLLAYMVILIGVSVVVFQRRDLRGGE